ncbi:hypothetical protein CASFOL_032929 [Castilleja foliolosa]|uniref:Uncharacterized protein n=1 Tax=Castilleja foliolosa TaxID=1961234 RepID=A0ABD3C2W0_9LAMI
MDKTNLSYEAGKATGQAQEKANQIIDKAGDAAQSAKESVQQKVDNSNTSYQDGKAKGEAQEKTNQIVDKAGDAAQSAKESVLLAGQFVQEKAQNAVDAAKNATGMNK